MSSSFTLKTDVTKKSTALFNTKEIKYHNNEKQKVKGINKSSFELLNRNGLNKYIQIYQNGIKQDIEIRKFLIGGDNWFKSDTRLMFFQ